MIRPYVFLLLVFLIVAPVANGQDSGFATCTEEELLVYVDSILDISLLDASPVETMDDLVTYAAGRIDSRGKQIQARAPVRRSDRNAAERPLHHGRPDRTLSASNGWPAQCK